MKALLSSIKQSLFHSLGIYPIYAVIRKINKQMSLEACHALEAFAFPGPLQTRAFDRYPANIEAWEIDSNYESALSKKRPEVVMNSYQVTDPREITLDQMLKRYREISEVNGFKIIWHYYHQRSLIFYLALHIIRI